ncbi:SpoIIE family protein phosphatase [Streptomyces milbemycinicus]|uniref:SpoIIE family protein phosphatase n=1 Tax=Streptomyces milbemycinicus TaxID=476552 RepID=UPI0029C9D81C|nr:SpoIIE family protein phosphatase [Streptomyces milbemycinicus]
MRPPSAPAGTRPPGDRPAHRPSRTAPRPGRPHSDAYQLHSFPFHAADTLLLCTDGAIEARSSAGAFYPIGDRAVPWAGDNPQHLVRHILHDLQIYTGGRPDDDLAMVAIRRPPLAGRGPGARTVPPPPSHRASWEEASP